MSNGSTESFHATSVTRLVEQDTAAAPGAGAVEVAEVAERDPQRPGGKRFGSLVHELLARSVWTAGAVEPHDVEPLSRSLARMLDATEPERDAAVAAVVRALGHPILEQAKAAPECFRETPLIHRTPDGHLVEAVPDLVYRAAANEPWIIVDFKTDLRIDMSAGPYRNQVAHYVEALESATGANARGILLFV